MCTCEAKWQFRNTVNGKLRVSGFFLSTSLMVEYVFQKNVFCLMCKVGVDQGAVECWTRGFGFQSLCCKVTVRKAEESYQESHTEASDCECGQQGPFFCGFSGVLYGSLITNVLWFHWTKKSLLHMLWLFCDPLGTRFIMAGFFWNIVIYVLFYLREGWSNISVLYVETEIYSNSYLHGNSSNLCVWL